MTLFSILVLSRWIHFTAVCLLFGSSFFWFYMGGQRSMAGAGGLPRTLRATIFLLRIAAPVAALSGLVWLAGILANMTGGFGNVFDPENLHLFFFETQFGPVSICRLFLLAAAAVIAICPAGSRAWFAALLCVAALLLINQAWFGHAVEGGAGLYGAAMIIVYSVHMLAAGAWVGGLPPLLFTLAEQRRFKPHQAREWTFEIVSRYSFMAMVAVALVVMSGTANAGFRVAGAFDKLFWTAYGDVLVAKLAGIALMLTLALFNRFVAMPRLRAGSWKGVTPIISLQASVAIEFTLAIFVLGIAAVLGITPPPQ